MSNPTNNDASTRSLFDPLRSATSDVTLAQLQRAAAVASAAPTSWRMSYTLSMLAAVTLSAGAIYLFHSRGPIGSTAEFAAFKHTVQNLTNDAPAHDQFQDVTANTVSEPSATVTTSNNRANYAVSRRTEGANAALQPIPVQSSSMDELIPSAPVAQIMNAPHSDVAIHGVHSNVSEIKSRRELQADDAGDVYRFSAGVQAGVIYGSLNTLGGGVMFGLEHDWQYIGMRYTSTFGTKTNSDQLFGKLSDANGEYLQKVTEYGIVIGASIRQGNFNAVIAGGPTYTRSMEQTIVGGLQPAVSIHQWQGIGFSAQASFGAAVTGGLGLDLTGLVSFHSQVMYGATFLTLKYTITN